MGHNLFNSAAYTQQLLGGPWTETCMALRTHTHARTQTEETHQKEVDDTIYDGSAGDATVNQRFQKPALYRSTAPTTTRSKAI